VIVLCADGFEQLLATERSTRLLRQDIKQCELAWPQMDRPTIDDELPTIPIQRDAAAELDSARRKLAPDVVDEKVYPTGQLRIVNPAVERFVEARPECGHAFPRLGRLIDENGTQIASDTPSSRNGGDLVTRRRRGKNDDDGRSAALQQSSKRDTIGHRGDGLCRRRDPRNRARADQCQSRDVCSTVECHVADRRRDWYTGS